MIPTHSRRLIHEKSQTVIKYRTKISKSPAKNTSPNIDDNSKSTSVICVTKSKRKVSPNFKNEKFNEMDQLLYNYAHEIFEAKCNDLNIATVADQEKRFFAIFQQNAENRKLLLSENKLSMNSSIVLSKILSKSKIFSYIDLSKNKLGDIGIKNIVKNLLFNNEIVHLDISSNDISQSGISDILYFLSKHSSLYSLNLSSHQFLYRNKIGVCENLFKLLKCSTLSYLNLSGTNIGSEGFKYIILGLENNSCLTYLNLGNNSIKGNVIRDFVQVLVTTKINDLNLENNLLEEVAADEFAFFFNGYYGYGAISKINLAGNILPTPGVYKIFEALVRENNLEQLTLDKNSFIGYLDILERFLEGNKRLKHLSLSGCSLKVEAFCRLCDGLKENRHLETLILSGNSCKDVGAVYISKVLQQNASLQSLDLSSNVIKSEGGLAITSALRLNKTLKSLSLTDNELKDDVGEAFFHLFISNYTITKLKLQLNPMSAKYSSDIQKLLDRNKNSLSKNELKKIIQTKQSLKFPKDTKEDIQQKIIENKLEIEHIKNKIGGYHKRIQTVKAEEDAKLDELKSIFKECKEKSSSLSKSLYETQLEIKVSLYLAFNFKWREKNKRIWT